METKLSASIQRVQPSPTLAITQKAQQLKAQGLNVIGLGAGEPDFDTPEHIKQAGIDAISAGFTKYTAVDGIPSLKEAIIEKFKRDNQLDYSADQILVSAGCKHSLYNFFQVFLNPGDEVIIQAPYWVSYPAMVSLADGTPVILSTSMAQRFKLTPKQLEASITNKTKAIIFNSPSNPTGVVYSQAELAALAEVLKKHPSIFIISDDIYENIQWTDAAFCNMPMVAPELAARTIVFNGVSKLYAMTGWRIGYAAGPAHIIRAMKKLQGQSTSNPCAIAQKAAEAAITGPQDCIKPMIDTFKKRHDFVVEKLNAINGIECIQGDGTFYAFADISGLMNQRNAKDDISLAEEILQTVNVAIVPGSAFGAPGFMRISYAASDEALAEALDRLKKFVG